MQCDNARPTLTYELTLLKVKVSAFCKLEMCKLPFPDVIWEEEIGLIDDERTRVAMYRGSFCQR